MYTPNGNAISPNNWVAEHFSKLFHSENTQDESSSTKHIINAMELTQC